MHVKKKERKGQDRDSLVPRVAPLTVARNAIVWNSTGRLGFPSSFRKMFLLVLLLFSSPTSSSSTFYLSPLLSSSFFFIFLIRSPRSRPTSLVSRSQARSLMELFRRTISRAGSAFFIEHWPFELPWNSPRRIVTRELIQRKSSSGLGLAAG